MISTRMTDKREHEHVHVNGAGLFEHCCAFIGRGARGQHVVHQQYSSAHDIPDPGIGNRKRTFHIAAALAFAEAHL